MFFGIRFERKFIFSTLAILTAALSLTMAPAARAVNHVPDAMPTGSETLLYSFGVGPTPDKCKKDDGADPRGSLIYVPATGLLFGETASTTSKGPGFGTIFQIMPDGSGYAIDNFFAGATDDGNAPQHSAMTMVGNVLYGTTLTGGKNDSGSIFSINDDGHYSTTLLYNFTTPPAKNSGDQPYSNFVAVGNVLYGMTSAGGLNGASPEDGTIFIFDTSSGTYKRLYSFDGAHGFDPHGQLILDPNGVTFYGMTHAGGTSDAGVVFSFSSTCTPLSSRCKTRYKVLHNFSCPNSGFPMCISSRDGASPDHGTLVQNGSTLFGLTAEGGKYGNGVLFSIQTNGTHFTILHHFGLPGSNDGINPEGSLLLNGTTLYGTTRLGGNKGNGSVFRINTDGTNYDRIWEFQDTSDGQKPIDNVILVNNTLYGMTEVGGTCGNGAIFSLVPPP